MRACTCKGQPAAECAFQIVATDRAENLLAVVTGSQMNEGNKMDACARRRRPALSCICQDQKPQSR
jgi:hypothetical protein